MRLIAITGPMGSGKSTVAKMIADRGFPVFDCDRIFNTGVINSPEYIADIAALFGTVADGRVDKKALAAHLAKHPEDVAALNACAHPRVVAELLKLARKEAVAFVEIQVPEALDVPHELWLVNAPEDVRRARVAARDGRSDEQIGAMFALRKSAEPHADEIIDTDCTLAELASRVDSALRRAGLA